MYTCGTYPGVVGVHLWYIPGWYASLVVYPGGMPPWLYTRVWEVHPGGIYRVWEVHPGGIYQVVYTRCICLPVYLRRCTRVCLPVYRTQCTHRTTRPADTARCTTLTFVEGERVPPAKRGLLHPDNKPPSQPEPVYNGQETRHRKPPRTRTSGIS